MSVAWLCPNCPSHNSLFSFSVGLWPRVPTQAPVHLSRVPNNAELPCFFRELLLDSLPGVGCFLTSVCQIWPLTQLLLCHFLRVNVFVAERQRHGFPVFRYLAWLSSSSPSTTTTTPRSSNHCFPIVLNLFSREEWNTSFYIGNGRYLNFWSDPGCAH